jgi:hypothetical protein
MEHLYYLASGQVDVLPFINKLDHSLCWLRSHQAVGEGSGAGLTHYTKNQLNSLTQFLQVPFQSLSIPLDFQRRQRLERRRGLQVEINNGRLLYTWHLVSL